jgi:hypothetical protein
MKLGTPRRITAAVEQVKNQPVAAANGAAGVLGIAISFGLPITPDQKIGLTSAIVGAANWWVHNHVVPVAKLVAGTVAQSAPGQPVTIVAPDGVTTTVVGGSA